MTDAQATERAETADASVKLRSKNGVPKVGLAAIDDQAQKIWGSARKSEVAPVIVARALTGRPDSKASGGTWNTRIGALRLFRVVENGANGTLRLTPLGMALSNTADEAGHGRALKEAVLGVPAYASVLTRYDGGPLPEASIIASEYEYSYALGKSDASAAATLFIDSASYAGLVDEQGVVNLGGLVALPELETEEAITASPQATPDYRPVSLPPAAPAVGPEPEAAPPTPPPAVIQTPVIAPTREVIPGSGSGSGSVGVTVKLDMSAWPVDDVLRVLAALGYESTPGEPD
ncbi:hypothetical protein ACFWGP_12060 [Agromyces sp. NPDC127015]|uniref:hypothetical protein n=1 Tax=Agromyces sp. NPDC127015 TaxID=3347108 RepID=UPI0036500E80